MQNLLVTQAKNKNAVQLTAHIPEFVFQPPRSSSAASL